MLSIILALKRLGPNGELPTFRLLVGAAGSVVSWAAGCLSVTACWFCKSWPRG